jgi:hypothetical protein
MKYLLALVLASAVVVVGYYQLGSWLQTKVRTASLQDILLWRTLFYSASIHREPRKEIAFRLYGKDAEPLAGADITLNNLGLFSRRDYAVERAPNEFRIVAIGGEQTASSVVNVSWPDFLEDELNRRDPSRPYRVINLGWPDAGPEHYVQYWRDEGVKFGADLVIVNFVEGDFYRKAAGTPLTIKGQPIEGSLIEYRVGDLVAKTAVAHPKGRPVTSYRDPLAVPGKPYGFFAPPELMRDPEKVRALQEQIVSDMIAGGMPSAGDLLAEAMAKRRLPSFSIAQRREFDSAPPTPVDQEKLVEFGVRNFGWLVDNVPNLLLVHNFIYYELNARWALTEAMTARAPRIKVVDPRKWIPAGTPDEELRSWYMMAHMPEKWSQEGHEAYGRLMARVVDDWRAGKVP